ncbi:CBS domain-containing protein [Thiohalorhabdus methylotrophus]|uniref:CBS domain-containing protein n=1 Tax=Thiohalorhabdus methylotrophus TaxID=3242694 RepID=A0ABV4TY94_9GAMM
MNRQTPVAVVTSHPNADLDALGSMVAAGHLVSGAVPVLAQGAEPAANWLLRHLGDQAPRVLDAREVDARAVETLVVVDTRDLTHLGPFSEIARDPRRRLLVYDHHGDGALPEHAELIASRTGSNTAGMVAALIRNGVRLTPAEATVLAAGVYEDTGMLTFAGVTDTDFEAARWLLDQGADLSLVGRLLRQDLSPAQIHLLDQLLEAAEPVSGLRHAVLLGAVADPGAVQDAANVVQRLMDSVEAEAFFALIQQGARVFVIARAHPGGPDVGQILGELGGGGHGHAASASLPGVPLAEVREQLVEVLTRFHGHPQTVGALATRQVHSLQGDRTVTEAAERLGRYPLARMPVVDDNGRPMGWVDQTMLARARAHGLGEQPLAEYVAPLPALDPDESIHAAEGWILDRDYPLVAVVEEGRLAGILTRSDLIRNWREESPELPDPLPAGEHAGSRRNLSGRMREMLPRDAVTALERLGGLAAEAGERAFLVGGLVRDIILHRRNTDVDVVVEGAAIDLGNRFAREYGWHLHAHQRFGTAVLLGPEGERIDLATSRIEHYPYPAALPEVEAGSIKADLFRRDFTINALAVELDGTRFGRLLDLFGGLQDIRQGTIRVLHSLSFVEDPTRILRAARFEAELAFQIDAQSLRLIRNAVDLELPARLSGHRLFRELRYLLEAGGAVEGVRRLAGLGMLRFVHPALEAERDGAVERVEAGRDVLDWYRLLFREEAPVRWKVLLTLLLWKLPPEELGDALTGFEVRSRDAHRITGDRRRADRFEQAVIGGAVRGEDPAGVFEHLERISLEIVLALMAVTGHAGVREAISHYIQHLRGIRGALSGSDLIELGVPQGPEVGRWLERLVRARVRGEVNSAEEERELVVRTEGPVNE